MFPWGFKKISEQWVEIKLGQIIWFKRYCFINPFTSYAPFLYSLKTSENREGEKGCIENKCINQKNLWIINISSLSWNIKNSFLLRINILLWATKLLRAKGQIWPKILWCIEISCRNFKFQCNIIMKANTIFFSCCNLHKSRKNSRNLESKDKQLVAEFKSGVAYINKLNFYIWCSKHICTKIWRSQQNFLISMKFLTSMSIATDFPIMWPLIWDHWH